MGMHNLENRGFDKDLDHKMIVVDSSFFSGSPPSGKFDIYYVVWKKGERDEAVRVGLGYYSVSRGW
ncbi:hypothetical protein [Bacillus sp. B15-48]|uniref:hypothetical protein n=1 Tax=Bacillus sp. B15-48 TaxID=1548601 RepID=UPI00193F7F15|nr:hypothetical protein [Bacillus sp. B15-48]